MKAMDTTPAVKRSVCRRLFDAPTPSEAEENSIALNKLQEQLADFYKQRWNFDFATDSPIDGRFDWRLPDEEFVDDSNDRSCKHSDPLRFRHRPTQHRRQTTLLDYFPTKKHYTGSGRGKTSFRRIP
jgi:hypothetical protein